jgi:hypothetical protein
VPARNRISRAPAPLDESRAPGRLSQSTKKAPAGWNKEPPPAADENWGCEARKSGQGILTRVNADGLRALKILAVERDMTLQALGVEALNDVLVKHGKRPVVKNPLL